LKSMVTSYMDSAIEEIPILAAMNSGYDATSNNLMDMKNNSKSDRFHFVGNEDPSDNFHMIDLSNDDTAHLSQSLDSSNISNSIQNSRPTRETVLKRLYEALMRRSLVKVRFHAI
jgi:hypothetical protein